MVYLNKIVIMITMLFVISVSATDNDRAIFAAISEIKSDTMFSLLKDSRFNPLFQDHERTLDGLRLIGSITNGTSVVDSRAAEIENLAQALNLVLEKYPESSGAEKFVRSILRALARTNASEITNTYLIGAVEIAKKISSMSLEELKSNYDGQGSEEAELRDRYFSDQADIAEEAIATAEKNTSENPEAKLNALHIYLLANKDKVKTSGFIVGLIKDLLRDSHDNGLALLSGLLNEKTFEFVKKIIVIDSEKIASKSDRLFYEIKTKLQQCMFDPRIVVACIGIILAFTQGSIAFAAISLFMIFSDRILAVHGKRIAGQMLSARSYVAMIWPYVGALISNIQGGINTLKNMDAKSIEEAVSKINDKSAEDYLKSKFEGLQTAGSETLGQARTQGGALWGQLSANIAEQANRLGQLAETQARAAFGDEAIDKLKSNITDLLAKIPDAKLLEQMYKEAGDSLSELAKDFVEKRTDGVEEPDEPTTMLSFAALRKGAAAVSSSLSDRLSTMTNGASDTAMSEFDAFIKRGTGTMTCEGEFGAL